jgi:hypothetical protein
MHRAAAGIVAAVACFAAWRPGVAEGEAPSPRAAAQADLASSEPLLAAEAALWERLRERGRPDELEAFLVLFPQSRFAAEVRRRRDELAADASRQRRPEEARPQTPRPRGPAPPNLSAAAAAAAVAPDCGLLAAAADETSVTVAGVLRRGQERLVQGMLDAFGVPADAVRLRLDPFEGPYCGALSAVLMDAGMPPPDSPPRVGLLGARPLPEGDRLRLRVEMPEWPAHLSVFFLMVSGEAAALVSDPQPRPPGAGAVLEDRGGRSPRRSGPICCWSSPRRRRCSSGGGRPSRSWRISRRPSPRPSNAPGGRARVSPPAPWWWRPRPGSAAIGPKRRGHRRAGRQ